MAQKPTAPIPAELPSPIPGTPRTFPITLHLPTRLSYFTSAPALLLRRAQLAGSPLARAPRLTLKSGKWQRAKGQGGSRGRTKSRGRSALSANFLLSLAVVASMILAPFSSSGAPASASAVSPLGAGAAPASNTQDKPSADVAGNTGAHVNSPDSADSSLGDATGSNANSGLNIDVLNGGAAQGSLGSGAGAGATNDLSHSIIQDRGSASQSGALSPLVPQPYSFNSVSSAGAGGKNANTNSAVALASASATPSPGASSGASQVPTQVPTQLPTGASSPVVLHSPTPEPTIQRPPDTNYVDQALDAEHAALMSQIANLPLPAPAPGVTGTLVSARAGGRAVSQDGSLTVAMLPGVLSAAPVTETLHVQINQRHYPANDPRATRHGQPLALQYELTANKGVGGPQVKQFNNDVNLVWNIDVAQLAAQGVVGWPLHAYTYDEDTSEWVEIPSFWNAQTNQLVARTSHFSLKAVGGGFDAVNNYLPTVNNFEVDLQSGTASASYPINLPAGPGGFGPKVSLSYNSGAVDRVDATQQGPSSVGWGWTLSTSYIAASQHGGQYSPWTVSIVSDGANGDLVKGTDGYWHTASESFAKISYDTVNDKWDAWSKDGIHYVFDLRGQQFDSTANHNIYITNRWMLHTATDTHGNTITYGYRYEDKNGGDQSDTPFVAQSSTVQTTTRAIYPRQILYGAGGNQIEVDFHITDKNTRLDHSINDDHNSYQGSYIDRIDVKRQQQASGLYQLLRSYVFQQDFSTLLGAPNDCSSTAPYKHLTLNRITVKGNDNTTRLPDTTFTYYPRPNCGAADWYPMQDWGHLYHADNGYGGSVWYYYDAAGGDVSSYYRRVRAKRVRDGLLPLAPSGQSNAHDVLYTYDYRGAATNTYNVSAESNTTTPLHDVDTEFRGFGWVGEFDPSGFVTEHYYTQDDTYKAKEWRTQTNKEDTFTESATAAPTNNSNWTASGHIDFDSTNSLWKMWSDVRSSVVRTANVIDGSDVSSQFNITGSGDKYGLEAKWILRNPTTGDYWGLKIARNPTSNPRMYEAYVIWSVTTGNSTNAGSRYLSDLDNTATVRPFRSNQIWLNQWYTVMLHTSPDGRFAMELTRDNRDYIQIKSTDPAYAGGPQIPTFPTGGTWRFEQITDRVEAEGIDYPGFQVLLDNEKERRTVYLQSDSTYTELAPVRPSTKVSATWQPGLDNNMDGIDIFFTPLAESSSTTYGASCCQLGQVVRTRTRYQYTTDAYRNLNTTYEDGDLAVSGDERTTYYGYNNLNNSTRYLLGKVAWSHVYSGTATADNLGSNWVADSTNVYQGSTTWSYMAPDSTGDLIRANKNGILAGQSTGESTYTAYHFDAYGNQDQVTDGNGNTTTTAYDPYYYSFPMTTTYPNGMSEVTQWDPTKDVPQTLTDVNGTVTQVRYDALGRPDHAWIQNDPALSDTNPSERYVFSDLNQTSVTPPFKIKYLRHVATAGQASDWTWQTRWFDGRGRTVQDESPKDANNTIMVDTLYSLKSEVWRVSLPYVIANTNIDTYTPPASGTNYPYVATYNDAIGRPTITYNPDGTSTWNEYNWLNRVDTIDEGDHNGANRRRKIQSYDAYGRLVDVDEYDATSGYARPDVHTRYTYDTLNNLKTVVRDAGSSNPVTTTIQYTGLSRKASMSDPDMGTYNYSFDGANNLVVQSDALYASNPTQYASHQVFIDYDSMNRPIAKYYGQAHHAAGISMADVRYYYDNALGDAATVKSWGKLRKAEVTGVTGVDGTSNANKVNAHLYEYNFREQLTKEQITSALSNRTYIVSYTYDTGGRLTSTTYPDPDSTHEQTNVQYNTQAIGLPVQLSSNKTTVVPVRNATYNERGQLTSLEQGTVGTNADLVSTSYTYDDATTKRGWLKRTLVSAGSSGITLLDLNTGYFDNGNIETVSQNATGTNSPTFTNSFVYDGLNRLRSAQSKGSDNTTNTGIWPAETYGFDSLDRMTTRTIGAATYNYAYNDPAHKDAPTAYQGNTYSYDADGEQVQRTNNGTTQTRKFDPEGRLESITQDDVTSIYIYDANGQRLIKQVSTNVPPPPLVTASVMPSPPSGLLGEYYSDKTLTTRTMARYDSTVNFNWGSGSPDSSMPVDNFSVRWTGTVTALAGRSGTYAFYTTSDDGVRLWVNGQQIINNWTDHGPTQDVGYVDLVEGTAYSITLEYYESGSGATVQLAWIPSCPTIGPCQIQDTPVVVPASALSPGAASVNSVSGVYGQYFDNADLTNLKVGRYEGQLNFNWGTGSPDPSVGADTFSARWTAKVKATTTGTYTFYVTSDDGVRLWVNGQQLVNDWTDHAPTEFSGQIALTTGQQYDLRLEYYEQVGGATVQLSWLPPGGVKNLIPVTALTPVAPLVSASALYGQYYDNADLTNFKMGRYDSTVNFNWGSGSPDASMGVDTFSARWRGKVLTTSAGGTYTFYTVADDGVRLWVNGQLLIDNWVDQAPTERSGTISLQANTQYDIKLEYYENGGGATVQLLWLPPGGTKQVIPVGQLLPPDSSAVNAVTLYVRGLYEEDITNRTNPSPPYTSYYNLSGKTVGMRRANQPSSNGQFRLVGDYLGSTSLLVDQAGSVVQRTYYKPYGEAAWSWSSTAGVSSSPSSTTSLTSVGYTGQRLDSESGLMYYGARFYDPALSYFGSADTVAPDQVEPKTRNRYAYTLNNPLSFVDPSGHVPNKPVDPYTGPSEAQRKADAKKELSDAGVDVTESAEIAPGDDYPCLTCLDFTADELEAILQGIRDLMTAAGWKSYDDFRAGIGLGTNRINIQKVDMAERLPQYPRAAGATLGRRILFNKDLMGAYGGGEINRRMYSYLTVHEIAHVWDNNRGGKLSAELWAKTTYTDEHGNTKYTPGNEPPSVYGRNGLEGEAWAESVAAEVYGNDPLIGKTQFPWYNAASDRQRYVRQQFCPSCGHGEK